MSKDRQNTLLKNFQAYRLVQIGLIFGSVGIIEYKIVYEGW